MINEHWKTIKGFFTYDSLYENIVNIIPENEIMVELGCWLGQSTCFMAQKIKESGKKLTFYACDLFATPSGIVWQERCEKDEFYSIFLENLGLQEVTEYVIPVISDTLEFAKTFPDKSIFFLYVDDNHEEDHVYNELKAWLPKMKKNGIMSGHDSNSKHVQKALWRFSKDHNLFYELDFPTLTWTIYLNQKHNR